MFNSLVGRDVVIFVWVKFHESFMGVHFLIVCLKLSCQLDIFLYQTAAPPAGGLVTSLYDQCPGTKIIFSPVGTTFW